MLLLAALLAVGPAHAAPKTMTAEATYALGLRQMNRGYYLKALEQFNRVRTYFRDDPYALKAELAIADIHFKKSEWDEARLAYEDFIHAHPRYPELDYVVYRLGFTIYQKAPAIAARDQTWTQQAINKWTGFSARFPDSTHGAEVAKLLGKARDRMARKELIIGRFYARRKAWPAVVGRLDPLVQKYGDTAEKEPAVALLDHARKELARMEAEKAAENTQLPQK